MLELSAFCFEEIAMKLDARSCDVTKFCVSGLWVLIVVGLSERTFAEPPPKSASKAVAESSNEITAETVQARLKAVTDNTTLEPQVKTRLTETYNRTLEAVQASAEATARKDRYTKQTQDVPTTLKGLKQELEQPQSALPLGLAEGASLQQGQQRLSQVEADLVTAQKALKDSQDEPKNRTDRRAAILKHVEGTKAQLQELDDQLEAKPHADELPEVTSANRLLLEARRQAIQAETLAGQAESRYYESAAELMPLQRDLAARKVEQLEDLTKRLREQVNAHRRREAEMQAREAQRTAMEAKPSLRAIAERNEELAKDRQALAGRIERTIRELESTNNRVAGLGDQFSKIQNRVKIANNNQAIGLLLRKQREELPRLTSEEHSIREMSERVSEVSLKLIDFQDRRNDLASLDKRLEEVLSELGANGNDDQHAILQEEVRKMLEQQRNLLDAIISDTNSYLDKLVELNTQEEALIQLTRKFATYCDERIMWIPSAPAMDRLRFTDYVQSIQWLVNRDNWKSVTTAIWSELTRRPLFHGFTFVCWLAFVAWQPRLKRWLNWLGEQAVRNSCRTFLPTGQTLLATVLLTIPWPAFMAGIGNIAMHEDVSSEFSRAIGESIWELSANFAGLELVRQICRSNGLAEAHFSWDSNSLKIIRRWVRWIMAFGLPLAFILILTEHQSSELVKNTLGRCAFMCVWLVLLVPAYEVTRLSRGALTPAFQLDPKAWWSQFRRLWPALAIAAPLVIVGLAAGGYYYTAVQVGGRLVMTIWLTFGLVVAYCVCLRWLLTAHRSLGHQRLQLRRATAEASSTTTPLQANTQLEIKLSDINQQTRQMLQLIFALVLAFGTWWIWSAIVPALEAARHIPMWTMEYQAVAGGEVRRVPITLADLVLAIFALTMTITLTKNIQSLLELTFISRLSLDAGVRYAVATIARYAITATGGAIVFTTLGFNWSQIQWLVAAVGVGLGFGLQEIFSNFASGIVLLFERPIRIGDIVTLGNVEGKVSDIQLRATTITDWDEREIVIPNKDFITNRVVNWTLSNTISRMTITVGVAYGVDPDNARNLLLEMAMDHPLVLKDPAPQALLDEFDPSSMRFVLRVYLPTRSVFLQLRHELMTQIVARFQKAGIEIAFPQCDVRVQMLDNHVVGPDADGAANGVGMAASTQKRV